MGSIRKGRHVLLVDVEEQQERALSAVVAHHPTLRQAHDGVPDVGWSRGAMYNG
jgi:hypothetical protein